MSKVDFDVVIIGGGPAGSALASYLAKEGVSALVLEKALFPREHVGESLVPAATRVFKELDFLGKLDDEGFCKKYGAAWTSADKAPVYDVDFDGMSADCHVGIRFEEREQPGVDRHYTYHVDRAKFDLMLLQHAHGLGATVYEGLVVKRVDFANPEVPRVSVQMGAASYDLTCRFVVDASGRSTVLGSQLRLKVNDPVFNQYALHTWFKGYDRSRFVRKDGQDDFIFIHFLPVLNTWVWQIPITDDVTSIGVVTQKPNFAKKRVERERFFWECLESRPELCRALRESEQIRPLREEGDYSYAMKEICGDGFALIGDAARFVDPIFSSGVSIALNSARLLARDLMAGLEGRSIKKDSLRVFERKMRRGTANWYEFINLYYRLNVLFTSFVRDERYRGDVIKLLQGDVYDDESPEVLRRMREVVTEVESNTQHIWHPYLGDLSSTALERAL